VVLSSSFAPVAMKMLTATVFHRLTVPTEDVRDAAVFLREQHPSITNQAELLSLMGETQTLRRRWIKQEHPTINEILKQYPHFRNMPEKVFSTVNK